MPIQWVPISPARLSTSLIAHCKTILKSLSRKSPPRVLNTLLTNFPRQKFSAGSFKVYSLKIPNPFHKGNTGGRILWMFKKGSMRVRQPPVKFLCQSHVMVLFFSSTQRSTLLIPHQSIASERLRAIFRRLKRMELVWR